MLPIYVQAVALPVKNPSLLPVSAIAIESLWTPPTSAARMPPPSKPWSASLPNVCVVFTHNETATGALGDPNTAPKARVSYAAAYYDLADRPTATVDVGTNGGSAWTRPSSVPARSDTVLVTSRTYTAAGWVQDETDPKGVVSHREYDNLGRLINKRFMYFGLPLNLPGGTGSPIRAFAYLPAD